MQTVQRSPLSYSRDDWQRGYLSQPEEFDYWIDDVEGVIPAELQGTLYRNGPGLLDVNGQPIKHPFDGDGMVSAIAFNQGRAHFRNRFVRTEGYVAEQKAGRILYRGVFGTQKPGGFFANAFNLKLKNIANTGVLYWGEKLLALWEGAEPHRLDPHSLETIGIDLLDGVLQPGGSFAAHPRIDPGCAATNRPPRLVNFAVKAGLSSTVTIYEFDLDGQLLQQQSRVIPGFAFLHDFVITPNYYIFFQNPVQFNPWPFVLGLQGAGQCIRFRPDQPTQMLLIPRDSSQAVRVLPTAPCFVFHHANAFEQDDQLVVDSICYEYFPTVQPDQDFRDIDFSTIPAGQLWRFTVNLADGTVAQQVIEPRCCEFPSVHPAHVGQSYRYLYIGAAHNPTGNAPLQAILKLDMQSGDRQLWSEAPRGFMTEPLFVPRPGGTAEDDGWVLAVTYNAAHHRSDVVILDAQHVERGAIARLHLNHHIPYGLHGCFVPNLIATV